MKITTTFAMKVPGPEEYSSLAYHLTLEASPDETITQDRDRLADYTRRLFAECRQRVEEEMAEERDQASLPAPSRRNGESNGHYREREPKSGRAVGRARRSSSGSAASPKQLNYLKSLAREAGLGYRGLDELTDADFGKDVRSLTKREASQLIDKLRA